MTTTIVTAEEHLKALIHEIHNEKPHRTLAYFRVTYTPIYEVLKDFAETDTDTSTDGSGEDDEALLLLLPQVQTFFERLNSMLSEQEKQDEDYIRYKKSARQPKRESTANDNDKETSVVFGGKHSKDKPQHSISEMLVARLMKTSLHVYTVSRSTIPYPRGHKYRHLAKQCLDDDDEDKGTRDFLDVMDEAIPTWESEQKHSSSSSSLVFYFTLGQHKGVNPFRRNLNAARNFCKALETAELLSSDQTAKKNMKWRVVLTGTDATLPSDHKDSEFVLCKKGNTTAQEEETTIIKIPTYKIMPYNFVYAMSKLGQYYLVANTIAKLVGRSDLATEMEPIVARIQLNVDAAGENGNYQPPSGGDGEDTAKRRNSSISMEELDIYSRRILEIEQELQEHLLIAKGISICYTPLHARPWTQAAASGARNGGLSPKAYILEQVVKRLKNAISIEQAVDCHFPTIRVG